MKTPQSCLHGRRILVTRPAAQSAGLAQAIAACGGEAVLFPLLEIAPADDAQPLLRAIARLGEYACAIFISPNAVDFALPPILATGPWPEGLQAVVIGPGSAAQLAVYGVSDVVAPLRRYDTEALLELPAMQRAAVSGRRILLLRGNGGRELLAQTLRQRGARVDAVSCYRRSAPSDASAITALLRGGQIDALTISSSEGLRNLLALLDAESARLVRGLPLFVPHQRIAEESVVQGWARVVLTAPADAGIVESLCAHGWSGVR